MPNQNTTIAQKLNKGDVIWVPYRKDPLWPALVNNVYPKKVTYCFFPVQPGEETKKSRFSCAPKLTYALVTTEPLPKYADSSLKAAHKAACEYLKGKGKTRGALIESLNEAVKRDDTIGMRKPKKERKRKIMEKEVKIEAEELEDQALEPPPPKKEPHFNREASSSSDRAGSSEPSRRTPITDQQSKEMMKLINDCLETVIEEVMSNDDVIGIRNRGALHNGKLMIELKNNQFLSDSDYESLFDRVFAKIRDSYQISLISAFHITASHVVPHLLITCYSTWKNVDLEAAKDLFYQRNTHVFGFDRSVSIPVTDNLEELCRLACDESEAIQKK